MMQTPWDRAPDVGQRAVDRRIACILRQSRSHDRTAPTPPELYVRKTAPDGVKSTVLVSQSQLPGHEGEPAPNGSVPGGNTAMSEESDGASYVYASPDGSQAFFASIDQLTSAAPANGSVKEYDFDVNTGSLTYLPGVTGPIVGLRQRRVETSSSRIRRPRRPSWSSGAPARAGVRSRRSRRCRRGDPMSAPGAIECGWVGVRVQDQFAAARRLQ